MDATLILIDSDRELARARALVDRLWQSDDPVDIARLKAQARYIAAYEDSKWPRRLSSTADRSVTSQAWDGRKILVSSPDGYGARKRSCAR
jgi:hypothetical protein